MLKLYNYARKCENFVQKTQLKFVQNFGLNFNKLIAHFN